MRNMTAWNAAAMNHAKHDEYIQVKFALLQARVLSYEGRNINGPVQSRGLLMHRGERLDTILEKHN
jgi:hypothetical protein